MIIVGEVMKRKNLIIIVIMFIFCFAGVKAEAKNLPYGYNSISNNVLVTNKVFAQNEFILRSSISDWLNGTISNDSCQGYFGDLLPVLQNNVFKFIKILTPIILLLLTSLDFSKVVFSGDKESMSKAKSNFTKRAIAAIVIFFTPYILTLILNLIDFSIISDCLSNF